MNEEMSGLLSLDWFESRLAVSRANMKVLKWEFSAVTEGADLTFHFRWSFPEKEAHNNNFLL